MSSHDDLRGMIPWLVNGTLGSDERRQVVAHLAACATCRQELADTRTAAEIFDQHPPAAAILALAWEEEPEGVDPAFLDEHLAECPHCAAELEMARMSRRFEADERIVPLTRRPPPPNPATGWHGWKSAALAAGLAGVVASAGWFQTARLAGTLERQLAERPAAAAPLPAPAPAVGGADGAEAVRAKQAELDRKLQEVAGQTEALRAQEQELRGQLDRMAAARPVAPQVLGRVENLQPGGDVVRGGAPAGALAVSAKTSTVLLLYAAHDETHKGHMVEIVDAGGKVVWKADALPRDAQNSLYVLALPAQALPAGTYAIRVYGTGEGKREPVESYSIKVA